MVAVVFAGRSCKKAADEGKDGKKDEKAGQKKVAQCT